MNYFIDILKWCWTENWNLQRNDSNRIAANKFVIIIYLHMNNIEKKKIVVEVGIGMIKINSL